MTQVLATRRLGALPLILGIPVVVGVPFFFVGGFLSYFMNDMPGGRDHLSFSAFMAVGGVVAAACIAPALRFRGWRSTPAIVCAIGSSAAVTGVFLAGFFATSAKDVGSDPSTFYGAWTVGQVYAWAALCGSVALVGLVAAFIAARRANV